MDTDKLIAHLESCMEHPNWSENNKRTLVMDTVKKLAEHAKSMGGNAFKAERRLASHQKWATGMKEAVKKREQQIAHDRQFILTLKRQHSRMGTAMEAQSALINRLLADD